MSDLAGPTSSGTFALLGAAWLSVAAVGVPATPATPERTPVSELRPLLLAALASPTGEAHGVLVGPRAATIAEKFSSVAPLDIDVATAKRYAQAGCARLTVLLSQEGVTLPGETAPARQSIALGVDVCRDGQPPRSLAGREGSQ